MSDWLPETPLLFYPSLAHRLGSDEALLLYIYTDYGRLAGMKANDGCVECILPHSRWLKLAGFWSEERLRTATESLERQGCLQANLNQSGTVRLRLLPQQSAAAATPAPAPEPAAPVQPPVQQLPVYDAPPPRPARRETMMQRKGPAPTFGGSIGWRRHKDELQAIFEQAEERNQQLQSMYLGWEPSDMFHAMLPRHSIPAEFAVGCLDEFVLYWLDKDRKESNWDQKFLAWVKREWVKKQTRDAREQRYEQERQSVGTGGSDENTRRDSRENRKRTSRLIMDFTNTDDF